ncbi:MAG: hypothetical protein AAF481_18075 [Acidobacteriota bacterium]
MITGYNTDVRHGDVVLHVQTEDKGENNPRIESLVYFGGQVLASRRAEYGELIDQGKEAIVSLMDRQHRTMIAAIRSGRLDDKLAALRGGSRSSGPVIVSPDDLPKEEVAKVEIDEGDATHSDTPEEETKEAEAEGRAEQTLDQVILEYLTSEADQEHLQLELEDELSLMLGQAASVALRAQSSKGARPIGGAEVAVKMISTVDEPKTLASGSTDGEGALRLEFEIPALSRGTAALIITASSSIGRAELKQLL